MTKHKKLTTARRRCILLHIQNLYSTALPAALPKMAENIYDEIEIEDMTYDSALQIYHYPCPCGDRFEIAIADLRDNEDIAVCPSCSLMIRVIFEVVSAPSDISAA